MSDGTGGPEIVTVGTGRHEQLADRAEIDVSFGVTGKDRATAVRDLGRLLAAARPALARSGLTVRSRRLRVHTEWRGRKPVGCRAGEDIALVVENIAVLQDVLGALLAAEPESLAGPRWTLADPSEVVREAQRRAVADARERAQGYAAALGGTLGALRLLTEADDHGGAAPMMRMAASSPVDVQDLGLEPEPVPHTARCTTTWLLRPPGD